jgi:type IV secretory pathway TrbD component
LALLTTLTARLLLLLAGLLAAALLLLAGLLTGLLIGILILLVGHPTSPLLDVSPTQHRLPAIGFWRKQVPC